MKKKTILAILLGFGIIAGIGVVMFALTNRKSHPDETSMLYSGKAIQPESHKVFFGAWVENMDMGFVLRPDSSAYSINAATLIYKKWKIENNNSSFAS